MFFQSRLLLLLTKSPCHNCHIVSLLTDSQRGLDSQHPQPRQRLHFLEKASRRVCASHAAHWQDRRRRRRGSTSPPLLLLLLLLLPLLLLLLLLSGRTELTGSRVAASTHDRPHPDPPPTLLDPPYCREKLLIALLCLRSTQAERLLRQGVNLNVPGVGGGSAYVDVELGTLSLSLG